MAVNYHDYLQLEKILSAQQTESDKLQMPAHDEMLFIIIHQAYELWFKQIHYELDSIITTMNQPALNDNSPELQTAVHRLDRMATIMRVLVHQFDIMETMTPMDFLDFRDMLRPASGFQSWQFKELEAKLGLKFEERHGKEYYTAQLRPDHINIIKNAENSQSLFELVNSWLERMPFFDDETAFGDEPFWQQYRKAYDNSLAEAEKNNLQLFDSIFFNDDKAETTPAIADINTGAAGGCPMGYGGGTPAAGQQGTVAKHLSAKASRAALFIMLYRGYPLLQQPFQLLTGLLEMDVQLSSWRYRHMNMVHRIIGTRIGTGGSTGKDYLRGAADKHYIFREVAQLNSFLIERRRLPALPLSVEAKLGFVHA